MNTPPDDENPLASFHRAVRGGLRVFWPAIIAYVGLMLFLPQPFKAVVGSVGMVVICLGMLGFVWWLVPRSPLMNQRRPAARSLVMRIASATAFYLVLFTAVTGYYRAMHPTGMAAILAALAPSMPLLFAIRAAMLFLKEETDEFLRSRMLEGWSLATGLALAICTVWGLLDQFQVVPHLPLSAAFLIWACCLVPAQFLLARRDA
jgi:hypothetical protein